MNLVKYNGPMKGWESDSMYVIYANSKSDKQGNDRSPKHLYTNLNEPHLNLLFVFALYLLSSDFNGTGSIFSDTAAMGDSPPQYNTQQSL